MNGRLKQIHNVIIIILLALIILVSSYCVANNQFEIYEKNTEIKKKGKNEAHQNCSISCVSDDVKLFEILKMKKYL